MFKSKNIFKSLLPFFIFFYSVAFANVHNFLPESLAVITTQSTSGGSYIGIRFVPKSWVEVAPMPDADNAQYTSNDIVLKTGKDWIYIFVDDYESEVNEEAGDNRFSNSFTSTCNFYIPGENEYVRQAINEGIFNEDGYLMVDNCKDNQSLLFGKGKCCAGRLKLSFASGKISTDKKGWTASFTIMQEGVNTIYKGVGAINEMFSVAADDATPDVSQGTATYLLPSNVAATEITDLDNAIQGSLITFKYVGSTNLSTFTDGAVFQLASAFVPVTGAIIVFQATTTGTFAERYRKIPA